MCELKVFVAEKDEYKKKTQIKAWDYVSNAYICVAQGEI